MFTGIVAEVGRLLAAEPGPVGTRLTIGAATLGSDLLPGESVAVDGVCLTVTGSGNSAFRSDVIPETLARSSLGRLGVGAPVNLERAVTPSTRLSGHLVQGHVDGVGRVAARSTAEGGVRVTVALPAGLARYVVGKGSIALNGVSLTVADLSGDEVVVALIPTTLAATTFGELPVGAPVNVEVDVLAKYVERLLTAGAGGRR
jgi:riboflavin synthase